MSFGGDAPIDPRFANLDASATIELCSSLADYGEAGGLSRDLMMQVGRFAEARYGDDLEVLLAVARMYLQGGEGPRARVALLRAGGLGQDEARVLPLLTNVLALLGDPRTAEQALREESALPPAPPGPAGSKKAWGGRLDVPASGLPVVGDRRAFTPTSPMNRLPGHGPGRPTTPTMRQVHPTPHARQTPRPSNATEAPRSEGQGPAQIRTEVSRRPAALSPLDDEPVGSSPRPPAVDPKSFPRPTRIRVLEPDDERRRLDPYELIGEIASGGMATVFLGRLAGAGGFSRFVAIKQLHPHLAREEQFVQMFLDEARLAAGIHNPHVVPILEVGMSKAGYFLVMEFIEGDTLAGLTVRALQRGALLPAPVALRILLDALTGLHAAHQLTDAEGQPLGLVHRDCTPQNILVGADGSARLTDFGVARAASRLAITRPQQVKGKVAYLSPEQAHAMDLDRRSDLFTMGIVLWEALAGRSLFQADTDAATLSRLISGPIPSVRSFVPEVPEAIDEVCRRALHRDRSRRFRTAAEMGEALELAAQAEGFAGVASSRELGKFVEAMMGAELIAQREAVRAGLSPSSSARGPASTASHDGAASGPKPRPPSEASPVAVEAGSAVATPEPPAARVDTPQPSVALPAPSPASVPPLSAAATALPPIELPPEAPVEKTLPSRAAPVADPPAAPPAVAAAAPARGLVARFLSIRLSTPRGIALVVLLVIVATSPLWLRSINRMRSGRRPPVSVAPEGPRPRGAAGGPRPTTAAPPPQTQPAWDEGDWSLPEAGAPL